jgi:uncharacterized membrane protein YgaE (UPF0421/DUF939 family)
VTILGAEAQFERRSMAMNLPAVEDDVRSWFQRKEFGKQAVGALKTGLAAVLSVALADLLGLAHGYWAAVSAIVVLGWDTTLTFASCRDRIIGTAIGAFMGWVTFYLWHGHYALYGVSVALCIFVCSTLQFDKAGRLAAATLSIIVLVQLDAPPSRIAISRFLEVAIGVSIALGISWLPPHPAKADTTPNV